MRLRAPILVWLLILGLFTVAAIPIVRYRESLCAKRCSDLGYASYKYRGFAGARYLRADKCECEDSSRQPPKIELQ